MPAVPASNSAAVSNESRPSVDSDEVELHFRALRRALRAKRVAALSDLSLLLASDGMPIAPAIELLEHAAAGDRRAIELAQQRVATMAETVPRSTTPPLAAVLLLAIERYTARN